MSAELRHEISSEEWAARVDLAACYRLVDLFGWSDLIETHISIRVPGSADHFLINPYGMLFEEITASSLVKVDVSGAIIGSSPYGVNKAGFVIHSAVHIGRPDVACVIHTHTNAGTAVASQRDGLLPITQPALVIMEHLAYHDYEGVAFAIDERERLIRDLGDKSILVLRNHGLLTAAKTVGEAFVFMYRAERACRVQLAFQSAGQPPYQIKPEIDALARKQGKNATFLARSGQLEWDALLRKLDRLDPSYKS